MSNLTDATNKLQLLASKSSADTPQPQGKTHKDIPIYELKTQNDIVIKMMEPPKGTLAKD